MSKHEEFSETVQEQPTQAAIFHEDGTLDEEYLSEHFGIGAEEGLQQVTFGGHTGTVAQMLADEKCPVGEMVGTAYQERGIDGVAEKFKILGAMDSRFSVKIAEKTIQRDREQVKKK